MFVICTIGGNCTGCQNELSRLARIGHRPQRIVRAYRSRRERRWSKAYDSFNIIAIIAKKINRDGGDENEVNSYICIVTKKNLRCYVGNRI